MKECAEVYKIGATAPGVYPLDTSGQKINNDELEVFCEEGWTRILTRSGENLAKRASWVVYYSTTCSKFVYYYFGRGGSESMTISRRDSVLDKISGLGSRDSASKIF